MNARMGIVAGFLGGVIAVLSAVGIAMVADGGSDGSSGASVQQMTEAPSATPNDAPQTVANTDECMTPADIYEDVRPSVVLITSFVTSTGAFGQQQGVATGTGVIIDDDGHILTNNHVVDGAQTLEVRLDDGSTLPAEVVGTDPANDLAVILVDPTEHDLTVAPLGDSEDLRVGDPVLALGNPFGLEGTLTEGIVSGLERTYSSNVTTRPIRNMIQTDAPINPGNSGGPLLNCQGEVIGINTLLENPTGENVNVGVAFAVSINTAKNVLDDLKTGETVGHAWLGIAGADVTPAVAEAANLDVESGVYLTVVSPGSPADDAGLVGSFANETSAANSDSIAPGGDVITEADGKQMDTIEELAGYLDTQKSPGDPVELTVIRDGGEITVTATLADWPS